MKAGRPWRRSTASCLSPPSRGSTPKTPTASATNSKPWTIQRTAGRRRPPCRGDARPVFSACDDEVIADLGDAACHPGGADHRVSFGPGTVVPAQRARVTPGLHGNIAVVGDQRVAVQGVLDQPGDIHRIGVVADVDVVL